MRRVLVAPGVGLGAVVARDGDADHLLTRPDCRIVKMQRKVVVGRITTAAGALYVKRYNVFAARVALASVGRASPAFAAWQAATVRFGKQEQAEASAWRCALLALCPVGAYMCHREDNIF